jgi:hypothetical protein
MANYVLTKKQIQHIQKVLIDTLPNVINQRKRDKQQKLLAEINELLNSDCGGAQHGNTE